jgi:hypothetical protein
VTRYLLAMTAVVPVEGISGAMLFVLFSLWWALRRERA